MRFLGVLLFLLFSSQVKAQFGLRVFYGKSQFNHWENILQTVPVSKESNIFSSHVEGSLDYWFRMKNVRLEFYPEVSYGAFRSSFSSIEESSAYEMDKWAFSVNTHLYFLDFLGDCDCPTFSKQGGVLRKGLFLLLKPGIAYFDKHLLYNNVSNDHSNISFQLAAGLGFDFGLNDLITVSPIVQINYLPGITWEGFSVAHGIINIAPPDESTSATQIQFGLRIGFRPDYKN